MLTQGPLQRMMIVSIAMQVWNRVLAPMSGQHGSEDIAEGSVSILKQALQVSTELIRHRCCTYDRCH